MAKVYLDPGHGGIDPGAEGCGKKESACALAVARKVMALLPGRYFEARMSRNSQNIPDNNHPNSDLNRRAREANNWGATIFVSIHLNAGGGTGAETYCAVCGGQSRVLARDIQSQVQAATGIKAHGDPVKTDNIRGAAGDYLCVIRETAMPAVLHECCFIDSAADMARFNPDRWALGIANGICKYFGVPTMSMAPQAQAAASSGGRSAIICTAQQFYNARGAGLKTDGYWGPATRKAATASVQRGCNQAYGAGLTVDGIWGPRTEAAVRTLRRGNDNAAVWSLQAVLMAHGYSVGSASIDGKFGAGTEAAVRTYQRAAGLTVDGLAGRATFAALCK